MTLLMVITYLYNGCFIRKWYHEKCKEYIICIDIELNTSKDIGVGIQIYEIIYLLLTLVKHCYPV